jgi:hypothetical protein
MLEEGDWIIFLFGYYNQKYLGKLRLLCHHVKESNE